MAAIRDDMPLVVGINKNWDEDCSPRLGFFAFTHENHASPSTHLLRHVAPRKARLSSPHTQHLLGSM